jgi:hypothetical protein
VVDQASAGGVQVRPVQPDVLQLVGCSGVPVQILKSYLNFAFAGQLSGSTASA